MMAKPSVLLPEPLGPIRACTSPRWISRFTPRRIGLPSTATCKSVIFSDSVIVVPELQSQESSFQSFDAVGFRERFKLRLRSAASRLTAANRLA